MTIYEFMDELVKAKYDDKLYLLKVLAETENFSIEDRKIFFDKLDKDTGYWARVFYPIVREVPDLHRDIYEGMDGLNDDTIQQFFAGIIFRGAAKSTIKNIFATKCACHQKHPVIMIFSETEDQAIADLRSITDEFETNELIKYFYFNNKVPKGTIWNAGYIELSNGVAIAAKGMNSRVRGFKHKNQRPTLVMLDDFESRTNLATEEMRKTVFDTIQAVMLPIGDVGCKFIFLNTIVSPLAYMQKQYELSMEGKGLFAHPQGKIVRKDLTYFDADGKECASWPNRYSMEWVRNTKQRYADTNDMATFYQEFYNLPKEESNPKFNTECIREINAVFVKRKYVKYIQMTDGRKIAVNTFLGFDPAVKLKAENDSSCICVVAVDANENYYILDIDGLKIKETEKPLLILDWAERFGIDCGTIETYAYQFSLFEWTTKAMRDLNKQFLFATYENGISKKQKYIEGLENPINNSKVSYLKGAKAVDEMKRQMLKFSGGKRTHDDLIDGLFLAMYKSWKSNIGPEYIDELIKMEDNEALRKEVNFNPYDWRTA